MYKSIDERRKYHREYYHKNKSHPNIELEHDENGRFINKNKKDLPENEIICGYNNGDSTCILANKYGVDKTIIGRILKKNGVVLRDAKNELTSKIGNKNSRYNGYMDITGTKWACIRQGAKYRNLEFSITIEYVWDLFIKQNGKCALSGMDIIFASTVKEHNIGVCTASLDRIDSSKGYIEGNVQWVYKDINFMKQDYSNKHFIDICIKIAEFNKGKK